MAAAFSRVTLADNRPTDRIDPLVVQQLSVTKMHSVLLTFIAS